MAQTLRGGSAPGWAALLLRERYRYDVNAVNVSVSVADAAFPRAKADLSSSCDDMHRCWITF